MVQNEVELWEQFAKEVTPRRTTNAAGATTWLNWTQYRDHGPAEEILGSVAGKNIVELGSGVGANLAHLATLGARCTGVDIAPTRTHRAREQWGHLGVNFVNADAVDHLSVHPNTYDIAYSIFGAVWFVNPQIMLPAVHQALTPQGLLVFSHLPAQSVAPGRRRVITKHHLAMDEWTEHLRAAGFATVEMWHIEAPQSGQESTLIARAQRGC